ncbi:hypothetical protein HK102_009783 [Quaeritorhiza haematococci]|nr:hypothetical protein HK102_009783 [Quaeritorhiza haematococci]
MVVPMACSEQVSAPRVWRSGPNAWKGMEWRLRWNEKEQTETKEKLTTERHASVIKVAALEFEKQELLTQLRVLTGTISERDAEMAVQKVQLENLGHENTGLKARNSFLDRNLSIFEARFNELLQDNEELKKTVQEIETEAQKLRDECSTSNDKLQQSNRKLDLLLAEVATNIPVGGPGMEGHPAFNDASDILARRPLTFHRSNMSPEITAFIMDVVQDDARLRPTLDMLKTRHPWMFGTAPPMRSP